MFGLLEKLKGRKVERTLTFAELVADTLEGKEHDPEEAEQTLEAAGKTVADFEAALKLKRDRRTWHAQWKAGEKGQQASRDASIRKEQLIREREQKLAEIENHYGPAIAQCDGEMANASGIMGAGHMALRKLQQTIPRELLEAEKAMAEKLRSVHDVLEQRRANCQRMRANVTTLERQIEKSHKGPALDRYERELEGEQRRYADALEGFESLQSQQRELSAQMNAIQARKLVP